MKYFLLLSLLAFNATSVQATSTWPPFTGYQNASATMQLSTGSLVLPCVRTIEPGTRDEPVTTGLFKATLRFEAETGKFVVTHLESIDGTGEEITACWNSDSPVLQQP